MAYNMLCKRENCYIEMTYWMTKWVNWRMEWNINGAVKMWMNVLRVCIYNLGKFGFS